MDPERWNEVVELFHAAAVLGEAERAQFLDVACRGDADLRRRVERLAGAHDRASGFMDAAAIDHVVGPLAAEITSVRPMLRFGPYEVVRELGRGGMGTVYLAERVDAQYEKRVAIKLVKRGMDTDAVLEQF